MLVRFGRMRAVMVFTNEESRNVRVDSLVIVTASEGL